MTAMPVQSPADVRASALLTQEPRASMPLAPRSVEEIGLPLLLLSELVLKVMHQHGITHLHELAGHMKLGVALLESLLGQLRKEALVEVRRRGALDGDVIYDTTQAGRGRAAEALSLNMYSGPAPVPVTAYTARVQAQSVGDMGVTRERMARALADVVVRPEVRDQLGAAMNSQRGILLYGPAGSGKTFLCEQMGRLLQDPVAIPHAVEVGGEIIRVYDPLVHKPVEARPGDALGLDNRTRVDERWVLCERPMVITGGELTLEMLDLVYDPRAGYYQAPPHFKANNGMFLVDDLGRQVVSTRQLLNRWMIPMEQHHDYLMLRNGSKFRIPFDTLLFFSTNMQPSELADEAFLRRIGYKIFVGEIGRDDFRRITVEACHRLGVRYCEDGFELLVDHYHRTQGRPLLACIPRDLVSQIAHHAAYCSDEAALTHEAIDWAWHNYFASRVQGGTKATMEGTS
jgi:predicted ATPase with chaperone activity